ncbi:hypothetical protein DIURU_002219 [Diutina rugosa]|uniref:Phosphoglycerate mutase n=1 Tax=Diutina rugosa TaxID=5481 RepID=A0A642UQX9_DIURU|nr:uncharacterized protein DIURU_002219 [Diutina rugosa]KAA8903708.1 hypothetical protein DIURU_002219 [Diutina rugosa]
MPKLVLLRHGQSEWNATNQFTGWVDVSLTEQGQQEAKRAGELIKEADLKFDVVHTSLLTRAIQTTNIALHEAGQSWLPVKRSWRLNERHYGDLQGRDKSQAMKEYGPEKFQTYRRSFDVPPPPITPDNKYSQHGERRYAHLDPEIIPQTESLKIVIDRLLPYWQDDIAADLLAGKTVLIGAHGNSLRALVKKLDNISDADIAGLNIPTGIPLVYELDDNLKPTKPAYYLDPEAAEAGAKAVAAQGSK